MKDAFIAIIITLAVVVGGFWFIHFYSSQPCEFYMKLVSMENVPPRCVRYVIEHGANK
jgi:hypothetical protein